MSNQWNMDWGVWKTEARGHMNSREENVIPSTTQNALLKWQFTQKKEIRLFTQFHVAPNPYDFPP